MTLRDEILADNPYFYWTLDDPTGSLAVDLSGNDRHGLYVGDAILTSSALVRTGTSVEFNSVTDTGAVVLASESLGSFPFNSWSVGFWYEPNSMGQSDHIFSYYVSNSSGVDGPIIRLDRDRPGGANRHYLRLRIHGVESVFTFGPEPSVARRQQIVLTWVTESIEPGINTFLYCQGLPVDSASMTGLNPIPSSGSFALAQEVNAQTATGSFAVNNFFNGRIDEFAFFPTVLSSSRVQTYWVSGVLPGVSASREIGLGFDRYDLFGVATTAPDTSIFRGVSGSVYVYGTRSELQALGATDLVQIAD